MPMLFSQTEILSGLIIGSSELLINFITYKFTFFSSSGFLISFSTFKIKLAVSFPIFFVLNLSFQNTKMNDCIISFGKIPFSFNFSALLKVYNQRMFH